MATAYFVPCPRGLEQALVDGLAETAIRPEVDGLATSRMGRTISSGVHFSGTQGTVYAVNLYGRIASRVLIHLGSRGYRSKNNIHALAAAQRWEDYFTPDGMIRMDVTVHKSPLQGLKLVDLRVKDGVCDRFHQRMGTRPSVDAVSPGVRICAYLTETDCTIYLDIAGEPFFRHGWRQERSETPLKENPAADILRLTDQTGTHGMPFYDPMYGSGTFLVGATRRVSGIVPGGQHAFAYEWLQGHDAKRFKRLRETTMDTATVFMRRMSLLMTGADISTDILTYVVADWQRADLPGKLVLKQVDVCFGKPLLEVAGVLLMNPPYGERIAVRDAHSSRRRRSEGRDEEDGTVFERASRIMGVSYDDDCRLVCELRQPEPSPPADPEGEAVANESAQAFIGTLKCEFVGWKAFVFIGDLSMPCRMRLKGSQRMSLYSGSIEYRLFRFDMVKGGMCDRPE